MESLPADKVANLRTIERFVEQAAGQGARLVLFPECCITGYWFMRNLSADQSAQTSERHCGFETFQDRRLNIARGIRVADHTHRQSHCLDVG